MGKLYLTLYIQHMYCNVLLCCVSVFVKKTCQELRSVLSVHMLFTLEGGIMNEGIMCTRVHAKFAAEIMKEP